MQQLKKNAVYLLVITVVLLFAAVYTFNDKIDANGDNCYYYILAKSLATGHGYCDLSAPGTPAFSTFPPGCAIMMTPLMWITDSFAAQNASGYFFLWGVCILFFLILVRNGYSKGFSLFISLAVSLNILLLTYATMTMSELPFAFITALFFFFLDRYNAAKDPKRRWLYFIVTTLLVAFAYQIRTQGVVLFVAFLLYLLFNKDWKKAGIAIAGFALGLLPWYLRNKAIGLNSNRYVDQILTRAATDHGVGPLPFADLPARTISQFGDIISKSLSRSVLSFASPMLQEGDTNWLLGLITLAVIIWGCWSFKRYRFLLVLYVIGNLGLIALWSRPSGNRYLTCFMPFMLIGFYLGLAQLVRLAAKKYSFNTIIWAVVCVFFVIVGFKNLSDLHDISNSDYPPQFQSFQSVAQFANDKVPQDAIVCSRKPELFYVMSDRKSVKYAFTPDQKELIQNLVTNNVDYVILDELGFSSTGQFLYPAIQKYPELFAPVFQPAGSQCYLLKFDRQKALLIK